MREALVTAPSGGGVVRLEDGSVWVVADLAASDGWALDDADRYRAVATACDETSCVVGGLLPPGAVTAEVVDARRANPHPHARSVCRAL